MCVRDSQGQLHIQLTGRRRSEWKKNKKYENIERVELCVTSCGSRDAFCLFHFLFFRFHFSIHFFFCFCFAKHTHTLRLRHVISINAEQTAYKMGEYTNKKVTQNIIKSVKIKWRQRKRERKRSTTTTATKNVVVKFTLKFLSYVRHRVSFERNKMRRIFVLYLGVRNATPLE